MYRPELPLPMPTRIANLPVYRGYPVPWFVEWIEGDPPHAMPIGEGTPEFRIMSSARLQRAIRERLCWVCGEPLSDYASYVAGPMCAVNRTSAEPPSHPPCARWSATACPFLSRPHMRRRDAGLPEDLRVDGEHHVAGTMIKRNPGAVMVWTISGPVMLKGDGRGGVLFHIGEPRKVSWFSQGRVATREEVLLSIETGLPLLEKEAKLDGPEAEEELRQMVEAIQVFLPE